VRIAVASDDGVSIAGHFGRCAGFLVYDVDNGDVKKLDYRLNSFGHHLHDQDGRHGHGHDHAHSEEHHSHSGFMHTLADCQAVICRGMGRRVVADLAAGGIEPAITSESISAHEAAALYAIGTLSASSDSNCCSH
jgi:predicted Fe-Mo cluster-binding NifX family protein